MDLVLANSIESISGSGIVLKYREWQVYPTAKIPMGLPLKRTANSCGTVVRFPTKSTIYLQRERENSLSYYIFVLDLAKIWVA